MTRINLVIPKELTDQHLMAEIKEINQLAGQFRTSLNSKKGIIDIPKNFTLNKGHVKYFYNKGKYLHKRFLLLKQEAIERKFDIKVNFNNEWLKNQKIDLYQDWEPSLNDLEIIRERIKTKINMKPTWYKYYGKSLL